MPLKPGKNRKVVCENINELINTGKYEQKQSVAIAMKEAGLSKYKKHKGLRRWK